MMYRPTVRESIEIFLRRRLLFVLVFGAVCLGGAAYLLLVTPQYLSTGTLVLHFDTQTVPNIDRTNNPTQMQGSNEHREILYSDADILRSPDLARAVIKGISLPRMYPKIAAQPYGEERKSELAVRAFSSDLVIDVGLQGDVLGVNFLSPDPKVARDAVQSLINNFFAQEASVYANPQLQFAEQEEKASKEKLTKAQNELTAFKAQHQISDLNQQVSQLLKSRTDVESRLNVAKGRVLEATQRRDALKQLLDSVPPTAAISATGEQYSAANSAEQQLDALKAKRSQMASTYREGSSIFAQLDAQIASLNSAVHARNAESHQRTGYQPNVVYSSIKTDYLRASAEATSAQQPVDVLTAQLNAMNQQLDKLESERGRYDDLVRSVQIQNDTYRTLAIRYETARVEANRNAQKISAAVVVSTPVVASEPARPRRKLVALATLMAALILATGSVLGMEAFDDRLRTPQDVARILRLPVFATFARDV